MTLDELKEVEEALSPEENHCPDCFAYDSDCVGCKAIFIIQREIKLKELQTYNGIMGKK